MRGFRVCHNQVSISGVPYDEVHSVSGSGLGSLFSGTTTTIMYLPYKPISSTAAVTAFFGSASAAMLAIVAATCAVATTLAATFPPLQLLYLLPRLLLLLPHLSVPFSCCCP